MKALPGVFWVLLSAGTGFGDSTVVKTSTESGETEKVYTISPWINGSIIAGGTIAYYYGNRILQAKPGASLNTVLHLSPSNVNAFDRGAAMQDPSAMAPSQFISDWLLYGTMALPAFLIFDKGIRADALNVLVVCLTTMTVMANAYAWGVGHIDRFRPYVYNTKESLSFRQNQGSRNSFYAGHVSAAATSTFFVAKVYQDYHPGGALVPWIYTAAVIPPAVIGYFRYTAGWHFPSDIIAGFASGAAIGVFIPYFHMVKTKKLSLEATPGGMSLTVHF